MCNCEESTHKGLSDGEKGLFGILGTLMICVIILCVIAVCRQSPETETDIVDSSVVENEMQS